MSLVRALVIDDDPNVAPRVREALVPRTVDEVVAASRASEGIRLAMAEPPAIVLLDINMPELDGFKVCRLLKGSAATRDVPILFLTIEQNMVHLARAFDIGATDYIRKPVNETELQARVRAALRDCEMMVVMREQARVDALTGLANRAGLDDALSAACATFERAGVPLSLMMLDVDHFKAINDERGHGAGDEVLRVIGSTARVHCRPYDTPCRFGGDEFAVIFGHVEGANARRAAERLLEAISLACADAPGGPVEFTVSAGLTCTVDVRHRLRPDELLASADAALYEAKSAGRDRLVVRELSSAP